MGSFVNATSAHLFPAASARLPRLERNGCTGRSRHPMNAPMFQSYDPPEARSGGAERVAAVRRMMAEKRLDALLVPRADEHQGEYVPASAARLKWLTGFSGSAGLAVLGAKSGALFVDGRYVVQAPAEVDTRIFEVLQVPQAKLEDWLSTHVKRGGIVGFEPWLHTAAAVDDLTSALEAKCIKLAPLAGNLVDKAWGKERPRPPRGAVVPHVLQHAGKLASDKIAELQ